MKFRILNTYWPALIWTTLIFVLLTIPIGQTEKKGLFEIPHLDKVVHVIMFGTLVFLWSRRIFRNGSRAAKKSELFLIFLISCLYGATMEFYQKYFTSRDFDIWDIVADIIGAGISWAGCWYYYIKKVSPYRNRGRNQN